MTKFLLPLFLFLGQVIYAQEVSEEFVETFDGSSGRDWKSQPAKAAYVGKGGLELLGGGDAAYIHVPPHSHIMSQHNISLSALFDPATLNGNNYYGLSFKVMDYVTRYLLQINKKGQYQVVREMPMKKEVMAEGRWTEASPAHRDLRIMVWADSLRFFINDRLVKTLPVAANAFFYEPMLYSGNKTSITARKVVLRSYLNDQAPNPYITRQRALEKYQKVVGDFGNGRLLVSNGSLYGYIDERAREVIPFLYTEAFGFSDNRALVRQNNEWKYINAAGETVIEGKMDKAITFGHGKAAIQRAGKWGFIDTAGRELTPFHYDYAGSFSWERVAVAKGGKWGYLDTSLQVAIPLVYQQAAPFVAGYAHVQNEQGRHGYIDAANTAVVPLVHDDARDSVMAVVLKGKLLYVNDRYECSNCTDDGIPTIIPANSLKPASLVREQAKQGFRDLLDDFTIVRHKGKYGISQFSDIVFDTILFRRDFDRTSKLWAMKKGSQWYVFDAVKKKMAADNKAFKEVLVFDTACYVLGDDDQWRNIKDPRQAYHSVSVSPGRVIFMGPEQSLLVKPFERDGSQIALGISERYEYRQLPTVAPPGKSEVYVDVTPKGHVVFLNAKGHAGVKAPGGSTLIYPAFSSIYYYEHDEQARYGQVTGKEAIYFVAGEGAQTVVIPESQPRYPQELLCKMTCPVCKGIRGESRTETYVVKGETTYRRGFTTKTVESYDRNSGRWIRTTTGGYTTEAVKAADKTGTKTYYDNCSRCNYLSLPGKLTWDGKSFKAVFL